ncbi:hypothetical protein [Microlunatus parietis]|uniref:Uncharacterized protein n=1 Tax=Microlunatus parietis TaxID=682979 RepID=A0A7Y9I4H9_9ACTN|nr:hypothetical protein [Microlunatus parietis]NYE70136.1 hypothetical protein [Microlunatus parietis]
MIAAFPTRRFQFWEYRVGHGSLLIRSPRGPEQETNVDVIFVGVEFVSLPRRLEGLELRLGTAEEAQALAALFGTTVKGTLYAVSSGASTYYVDALQATTDENRDDLFSSPFDLDRYAPDHPAE